MRINILFVLYLVQVFSLLQTKQLDKKTELKSQILDGFFSTEALENWIQEYLSRCGNIAKVFSIGKSVQNRELWVIEISNNPGKSEPKPNFKFVANIHGNEPSGRQLVIQFAEHLCDNYNKNQKINRLVDEMHLFLMPSLNPDGFELHRRNNGKGQDLNRNFLDPYFNKSEFFSQKISNLSEPETIAISNWTLNTQFVTSLSYHEGAHVVNYPFDGRPDWEEKPRYEKSPDDKTFQHLSQLYAQKNPAIKNSKEFKTGITNGAQWYPIYGGMQDWNYLVGKCFELTLEINEFKTQNPQNYEGAQISEILRGLWEQNVESMVNYPLESIFGELRGFVKEKNGQKLNNVSIFVDGVDWELPVKSQFGDYYRLLAPGSYNVTAVQNNCKYNNQSFQIKIPKDLSGKVQNFTLEPCENNADEAEYTKQMQQTQNLGLNQVLNVRKFGKFQPEAVLIVDKENVSLSLEHLLYASVAFLVVVFVIYFAVGYFRRRRRIF